MPGAIAPGSSKEIKLHSRYGLLTLAYLGGIYWLSSLPDHGVTGGHHLVQLASNVFHIPLYAGLAFCFLQSVSGGLGSQEPTWKISWLTVLSTGTFAALDEWHQSFVSGRYASVGDFLLDLVGIGGMFLILQLRGIGRMDPSRRVP